MSSQLVPSPSGGLITLLATPLQQRAHHYIIVAIDYFTKWVEVMPMFKDDGETAVLFLFNQIIARFSIPRDIVTDHGSHFQNQMMTELHQILGYGKRIHHPNTPNPMGR
jgi:hypothetical protein